MSVTDWSEAEDRRLLRMYCADDPPRTIREIADELDRTKSAVDRRVVALGLRGHHGDRSEYERQTGVALAPVIRPSRVERPARPTGKSLGTDYSTLVWSDVHFPFQDEAALGVLRQVARDLKPKRLVCLGDIMDFWEISDHRGPLNTEPELQATIDASVAHLSDMVALSGAEDAVFLGGNHEDRWARLLDRARNDIQFRQLLRLPKVQRALAFESVVGFEDLGYSYSPYAEGKPFIENGVLLYTHGSLTNKHCAEAHLSKYGKNVIFGHLHRIQNYTKRDLKGQEAGWCIGCLSTLDPHYEIFANWHHGFAVVSWKQVAGEWLFDVEQVRIHNGTAIWRGRVYNGAE